MSLNIGLRQQGADLEKKKAALTDTAAAAKPLDDFNAKLQEFQRDAQAAQLKARESGNVLAQAITEGSEKAQAAIDELSHKFNEAGQVMTSQQRLELTLAADSAAMWRASERLKSEATRKSAEEIKQATEQAFKAISEMSKADEEAAAKAQRLATQEGDRQQKINAQLRGIGYNSDAMYGDREQRYQAERAARAAELFANQKPGEGDQDILDQLSVMDAQHQLQLKQAGVGQSASDGYRQFFNELKDNAKSAGQAVHEVLGGAFDSLNSSLERLVAGQKVSWASFFEGLASQFMSLGLNRLEGMLGGALSGKSGGGGFLSFLFGGARADGGDVNSGNAYLVGERGPELWVPRSSGTIVPNHALAGAGGGGASYYIDARGANATDVEMRVQRALVQVHGEAVRNAVAMQQEARMRSPRSKF